MITPTDIFCLNELGKRTNNEDCISPAKGAATSHDTVFIVCDGVGGENSGEVASEIVCTSVQEFLKKEKPVAGTEQEAIQNAIDYANQKLAAYGTTDTKAKRMSTTLALVLLGQESVMTAWCGDTRIYHIREGKVLWKSKDHSLVSELISQGELTEEEARKHPRRNVITRSLNAMNSNNIVDFHKINGFETGDYLLLCTDGLLENVNESVISEILMDEQEKDKAKSFLSYCDGVTKDNFSMYLIKGERIQRKSKAIISKNALLIIMVLLVIAITILIWVVLFHS